MSEKLLLHLKLGMSDVEVTDYGATLDLTVSDAGGSVDTIDADLSPQDAAQLAAVLMVWAAKGRG